MASLRKRNGNWQAQVRRVGYNPRAQSFHRPDDIITSTIRPIRRLSARIAPDQDGFVRSSGFVVLDPTGVQPQLLLTYLRLPVICELMDLFASASMYPAISETDILALPFPSVDAATEKAVVSAVQEGRTARAGARALLDAAKRAVEIALEACEAAAQACLDKKGLRDGRFGDNLKRCRDQAEVDWFSQFHKG